MQDLNTSRINWGIPSSWKLNTGEGTVLSKEINSISTMKVNSYIHVTNMHIKKWAPFMNTTWMSYMKRASEDLETTQETMESVLIAHRVVIRTTLIS